MCGAVSINLVRTESGDLEGRPVLSKDKTNFWGIKELLINATASVQRRVKLHTASLWGRKRGKWRSRGHGIDCVMMLFPFAEFRLGCAFRSPRLPRWWSQCTTSAVGCTVRVCRWSMCRVHRPSIFSPLTVTRAVGLLPINFCCLERKLEAEEGWWEGWQKRDKGRLKRTEQIL